MIDRAARKKLAEVLRAYLDERMTAFEFDDALWDDCGQTNDPTVRQLLKELWYYYDDIKDHKVVATKEEWDYFQRILLLLESDGVLEVTRVRRWSIRQLIAACAVAVFIFTAFRAGWGLHLFAFGLPFALVSIPLWLWGSREPPSRSRKELETYPFSSVSQLWSVRRRAHNFAKKHYPPELAQRSIRSPSEMCAMWFVPVLGLLMLAPLCLLFQAMPKTWTVTSVRTP